MSVSFLKIIPTKGYSMEPARDIETLKEFHRVLRRTLRPPVYSVFCAIEDHAGPNSPDGLPAYTCFASDKTLAKEASVSRATVIRSVEELAELGLIKVENREGYSSFIWPLVTNYGYRMFMEEQQKRELQKATGSTEQHGVLQKATGGVAQSDTNETKLKNQENDKTLDTDVSNGAADAGPAKVAISPLKEIESEINQDIPASASSPPDTRSFNRRWRDRYEAVKDNSRDRSGVLGELWVEITGQKADYQLLNQLAKQQGSGFKVLVGLLKMAACDVVDDPKSYLRKVLSNEQQRGPYLGGNGGQQQLEQRPAYSSHPGRAIKPRGSDPGGRLTEAELLEGYQS